MLSLLVAAALTLSPPATDASGQCDAKPFTLAKPEAKPEAPKPRAAAPAPKIEERKPKKPQPPLLAPCKDPAKKTHR